MYQDLSMRHDWPVRKAIVDLLISMNRPSERGHTKIGLFSQVGWGVDCVFSFVLFFLGGKKSTNFIHRGGGWGVAIK